MTLEEEKNYPLFPMGRIRMRKFNRDVCEKLLKKGLQINTSSPFQFRLHQREQIQFANYQM